MSSKGVWELGQFKGSHGEFNGGVRTGAMLSSQGTWIMRPCDLKGSIGTEELSSLKVHRDRVHDEFKKSTENWALVSLKRT